MRYRFFCRLVLTLLLGMAPYLTTPWEPALLAGQGLQSQSGAANGKVSKENPPTQRDSRRPLRARPPEFQPKDFEGIFFGDVASQLQGERPANQMQAVAASEPAEEKNVGGRERTATLAETWPNRISPASLEYLVKASKLRLDSSVTTPAKFAGGGYRDARRDFHLLAVLFGIIEQYPQAVRWKSSASVMRTRLARAANLARVGTAEVYNHSKERMEDFASLLRGSTISDAKAPEALEWVSIADREPLMQLMEWGLRQEMLPHLSSEATLRQKAQELEAMAGLMEAMGELLKQPGMPDADDELYVGFAQEMVVQAQEIAAALRLQNIDSARESVARLDQACTKCHGEYK